MNTPDRTPATLLDRLTGSPAGARFRDRGYRRSLLYAAMSDHDDTLIAELGQQLRDGLVAPGDLARTSVYAQLVRDGLDALAELDFDAIVRPLTSSPNDGPNGRDDGPAERLPRRSLGRSGMQSIGRGLRRTAKRWPRPRMRWTGCVSSLLGAWPPWFG